MPSQFETEVLSSEISRPDIYRVRIPWLVLKDLLSEEALSRLRTDRNVEEASTSTEIKQQEEGSPGYRVDKWDAIVTVTVPRKS